MILSVRRYDIYIVKFTISSETIRLKLPEIISMNMFKPWCIRMENTSEILKQNFYTWKFQVGMVISVEEFQIGSLS